MTTQQEEQWKERDFERFRISEYNTTKRQHEPIPMDAVLKKKVKVVCQRCGSDRVVSDATAVWSVPDQRWELADILQETFCEQCGGSCWTEEVPVNDVPDEK